METFLVETANRWMEVSPARFEAVVNNLTLLPWMLGALLLASYWFVGEEGTVATQPGATNRLENRRRVILIIVALLAGNALVMLLQITIFRPHPVDVLVLQIPMEPQRWEAFRASWAFSSFPAIEAVLFGILALGLFAFNWRAGLVGLILLLMGLFTTAGIGRYWPSDFIAGASLGALVLAWLIALEPFMRVALNRILYAFEYYPVLAYPLGFIVLFDMGQHFALLNFIWEIVLNGITV